MKHTVFQAVLARSILVCVLCGVYDAAAWQDFTAEELSMNAPEWCKDADAMVLEAQTAYLLYPENTTFQTGTQRVWFGKEPVGIRHNVRIKIFKDSGKDRGNVLVSMNGGEHLSLEIQARTITPGGKTIEVKQSQIFKEEAEIGLRGHRRVTGYRIAFPGVTAGCILEFDYQTIHGFATFLDPCFFNYNDLPTQLSIISLTVPSDVEYAIKPVNVGPYNFQSSIETQRSLSGEQLVLTAVAEKIWIPEDEFYAPNRNFTQPHLFFVHQGKRFLLGRSSFSMRNWSEAAAFLSNDYFKDFLTDHKAARKIAQQIGLQYPDSLDRARALYTWVCDSIASSGREWCFDVGWDDERTARGETINDRLSGKLLRATDAEKVLILSQLCAESGLLCRPLLVVPTDERFPMPELPAIVQFKAMILELALNGQNYYLDPSRDKTPFGMIPWNYRGAMALPLEKGTDTCRAIPSTKRKNACYLDLQCTLDERGNLGATGTLTLSGEYRMQFYKELLAADSAARRELITEYFLENLDPDQIGTIAVRADSARDYIFYIDVDFSLKNYGTLLENEILFNPNCVLRQTQAVFPQDDQRQADIFLGMPDCRVSTLTYHLPEGFVCESSPVSMHEGGAAGLDYLASINPMSDGQSIVYQRSATRDHAMYSAESYAELRDYYGMVAKHDAQEVVVRRKP